MAHLRKDNGLAQVDKKEHAYAACFGDYSHT